MEAVANKFDRDNDGYIDYKEFVAALRPDRDVSYWQIEMEKIIYLHFISFMHSVNIIPIKRKKKLSYIKFSLIIFFFSNLI